MNQISDTKYHEIFWIGDVLDFLRKGETKTVCDWNRFIVALIASISGARADNIAQMTIPYMKGSEGSVLFTITNTKTKEKKEIIG